MILPPTKEREIIEALKKRFQTLRGIDQGSSIQKRFIMEAIQDLEPKLEFDDGRDAVENLTGIRVRKVGKFYF